MAEKIRDSHCGERFFVKSIIARRRHTLCIPSFAMSGVGEKDPPQKKSVPAILLGQDINIPAVPPGLAQSAHFLRTNIRRPFLTECLLRRTYSGCPFPVALGCPLGVSCLHRIHTISGSLGKAGESLLTHPQRFRLVYSQKLHLSSTNVHQFKTLIIPSGH